MTHSLRTERPTSTPTVVPFRPRPATVARPGGRVGRHAESNVIAFPGPDWRRASARRFWLEIGAALVASLVINAVILLLYSGVL